MKQTAARILYLEDDELDRLAFFRLIRDRELPWDVTWAGTLADARAHLAESRFDVIVADNHLPDGESTELFGEAPDLPFVLVTGTLEEQFALRTLERGADDYLAKDMERRYLEALPFAVEKTLHRKAIHGRGQQLTRELRESEQRLRATFNNVASGIAEISAEDRLISVNDRLCQMLGYAREELLGMSVHELTHPEDRPRTQELSAQLHEGRASMFEHEKRFLRRDGSTLWAHVGGSAVRDEAGGYLYSVGTVVDISARKAAEAQLQLHAAALEAAPHAVSLSQTDPNGTIVWVNPAFTRLTGYSAEEAIGHSHHMLSSGVQDGAFYQNLWGTVARGESWRGELVNRRKDGTLYYEEMGITHLRDEHGKITHYVAVKQDITARKQAEEAMRLSEQRYRAAAEERQAVMDATPAGICVAHDPQCHVVTGNAAAHEILGVPLGANLSATPDQQSAAATFRFYRDGVEVVANELPMQVAARTGETIRDVEFEVLHGDGTRRAVLLNAAPLRGADGAVCGAVGAFTDITERKRAEDAMQESGGRYQSLFNAIDEGFCIIEVLFDANDRPADYRFLEINPAFESQTGLHNVVGKRIRELAPEHDAHWLEEYGKVALTGEPVRFVNEARALNRWYDVSAYRVGGPGDRRVAVLFNDITEAKRVELDQDLATEVLKALNRSEGGLHDLIGEVLRLIREATGCDAVGLRLRQGDDCPYFQQDGFSDAFLREENFLCARSGSGAIVRDADGRVTLECTCGLVLCDGTDPSMPCFTKGGSFWTNQSTELLALPPEADPRVSPRNRCIHAGYQSVALMPIRSREQIIGLLQLNDRRAGRFTPERVRFFEGLARNIGLALQRKQTEEALADATHRAEQATAAAVEASRAKDHFLAVLSHELRNPLTPVLPALAALKTLVPEEGGEYLEIARRNVELEARLIDDLLDVTRIARGKVELDRHPVALETILKHAVEVCMPDIEARKLHFGIKSEDGPYFINADAARLLQVFWNLIKNAVKFTPHQGCVGVDVYRRNGSVVVDVWDSGTGIEPELLPRIFNAFEQGGRQTTLQFGGLGLGLAISKALVELHGGTVSAHSEGKDRGAKFVVTLPLVNGPVEAADSRAPGAVTMPAIRPLRILMVEDHGDTARILRLLLQGAGNQVEHAGDVATALQLAGEQPFDLLLSDLGLPDGSGIDLMRQLRERGDRTPGIALSGYGQEDDITRSREAGFSLHLTKPISPQHLTNAIAGLVGGGTRVEWGTG